MRLLGALAVTMHLVCGGPASAEASARSAFRDAIALCESEAENLGREDDVLRLRVRTTYLRLSVLTERARLASTKPAVQDTLRVVEEQLASELVLTYLEANYTGARYYVNLQGFRNLLRLTRRMSGW